MKWIGQHIWDFISRFRNDVYLEDIAESAQDHVVGIDADGKLYKQDVSVGDVTGVDISVGTGLDISQSNTTGGNYTSTINLDLTEAINTDGANRILTSDGNGNLTAEPNFTFDGNFLSLTAFTSTLTNSVSSNIVIQNTGSNVAGGTLDFKNLRTSGVDGDKAGQFRFYANNDGGTLKQVGEVISAITETAAGSEYGNVRLETLNSNSQLRSGLTITGVAGGNDKVNVTLGHDSASDTTISGNAIVNGSLTLGGHSFNDIDIGTEFVDADDHIMSSGAIKEKIEDYGYIKQIAFTTDSGLLAPAMVSQPSSGLANFMLIGANGVGITNLAQIITVTAVPGEIDHDSLLNFVPNEHIDWTGASAGTIHATNYSNDDVSVANLKTRLAGGFAGNEVSIGDANDTVKITGDLLVSGTTTTINTADLNVEDKNITLNYHATNDTSGSADGAGITVQDAVNATTDATINWNAASDAWVFSHKVSLPDNSGVKRNNFWLNTDNNNQMTRIIGSANGGNKVIQLPNLDGVAQVCDMVNSAYTANGGDLFPQAGTYTQVINLSMAQVYALNTTAVDIVPDSKVHTSQTMMLKDCWVYVTTPNYPASGVANTSNWAFQIGKTAAAGTYNKAKGFEGLINRLAYNQAPNRTNVYRMTHFPNASSNYGNLEPGLGLKVWTSADPTGSASTGSESIMSIRLVVQYTIIPS